MRNIGYCGATIAGECAANRLRNLDHFYVVSVIHDVEFEFYVVSQEKSSVSNASLVAGSAYTSTPALVVVPFASLSLWETVGLRA